MSAPWRPNWPEELERVELSSRFPHDEWMSRALAVARETRLTFHSVLPDGGGVGAGDKAGEASQAGRLALLIQRGGLVGLCGGLIGLFGSIGENLLLSGGGLFVDRDRSPHDVFVDHHHPHQGDQEEKGSDAADADPKRELSAGAADRLAATRAAWCRRVQHLLTSWTAFAHRLSGADLGV
jgi:hypothetical protein